MARTGSKQKRPRRGAGLVRGVLGRAVSRILRVVAWVSIRAAVLGVVVLGAGVGWYYSQIPDLAALLDPREGGSVTLVDANGDTFAWRGQQLGITTASDVSPHLLNAIVATEDRRFYWHFGIDLRGTARALLTNLRAGDTVQGGSSITQQVAKLIWFDNSRTLERKVKEIPAALALEAKFSKNEILSIYLNRAYLGA